MTPAAIKANAQSIDNLAQLGYTVIEFADTGKCMRVRATGAGKPGLIEIGSLLPTIFVRLIERARCGCDSATKLNEVRWSGIERTQ